MTDLSLTAQRPSATADALIVRLSGLLALMIAAIAASAAHGGDEADSDATAKEYVFTIAGGADAGNLAHKLVLTFMDETKWKKHAAEVVRQYRLWNQEHSDDMGRFLNDRLPAVILAALGGNIAKLKEGAVWIALYREFGEPVPSSVVQFVDGHQASLNRLLARFSWETAGAYVKNRQWQKDDAKKVKAKHKQP